MFLNNVVCLLSLLFAFFIEQMVFVCLTVVVCVYFLFFFGLNVYVFLFW